MKRGILLTLAVAGALGSSLSSAETLVCRTIPVQPFQECTQVSSGAPAVVMSGETIREPSVVHYVERQPAVVHLYESVTVAPGVSELRTTTLQPHTTVTTYEYSDSWPNTEPRVSKYHYSYGR